MSLICDLVTSAGNIVILPLCSLVAEPGCVKVNNLQPYSGILGVGDGYKDSFKMYVMPLMAVMV